MADIHRPLAQCQAAFYVLYQFYLYHFHEENAFILPVSQCRGEATKCHPALSDTSGIALW